MEEELVGVPPAVGVPVDRRRDGLLLRLGRTRRVVARMSGQRGLGGKIARERCCSILAISVSPRHRVPDSEQTDAARFRASGVEGIGAIANEPRVDGRGNLGLLGGAHDEKCLNDPNCDLWVRRDELSWWY